jgi:hypothetical protein
MLILGKKKGNEGFPKGNKSHESFVQMQMKPGGITGGQNGRQTNSQEDELHLQMKPTGIIDGHSGVGAGLVGIGNK